MVSTLQIDEWRGKQGARGKDQTVRGLPDSDLWGQFKFLFFWGGGGGNPAEEGHNHKIKVTPRFQRPGRVTNQLPQLITVWH